MNDRVPPCDDPAPTEGRQDVTAVSASQAIDGGRDDDAEMSNVLRAVAARLDEVLAAPATDARSEAPEGPEGPEAPVRDFGGPPAAVARVPWVAIILAAIAVAALLVLAWLR